jgi:hypothetical protein
MEFAKVPRGGSHRGEPLDKGDRIDFADRVGIFGHTPHTLDGRISAQAFGLPR